MQLIELIYIPRAPQPPDPLLPAYPDVAQTADGTRYEPPPPNQTSLTKYEDRIATQRFVT